MNRTNAAAIAAEPKTVPCVKCGGSGQYRNMGVCFQCSGTGREKVGVARPVKDALAKHVATLRAIYAASARPADATVDWDFNDSAGGISVYMLATEAIIGILTAGETGIARKVCEAFRSLPQGGHFVWYMAHGACDLRTWARMPGAAQRLALELAGVSAPITTNRKGDRVPATTFAYNE